MSNVLVYAEDLKDCHPHAQRTFNYVLVDSSSHPLPPLFGMQGIQTVAVCFVLYKFS